MLRRMVKIGVAACVVALVVGGLSIAQQAGGGGQGGGRQRGQGGGQGGGMRGDPAQFRQMMMTNLKERLGADDQAWKVMEPRLQKVMEFNQQTRAGQMRGMFGGRGGRGGQGGNDAAPQERRGSGPNGEQTAMDKAMAQLQTTLDNQSASSDDIKKALTAVRAEREKAQSQLAAAQEDLKKILTPRQEAVLVSMGQLN
jgi:hypothetical protein